MWRRAPSLGVKGEGRLSSVPGAAMNAVNGDSLGLIQNAEKLGKFRPGLNLQEGLGVADDLSFRYKVRKKQR